jgi:hypothetical protein
MRSGLSLGVTEVTGPWMTPAVSVIADTVQRGAQRTVTRNLSGTEA